MAQETVNSFSVMVQKIAAKSQAQADLVVRKATYQLLYNIVLRSPVGNPSLWKGGAPKGYVGGRFRANWNFSVGEPNESTLRTTRSQRGLDQAQKALGTKAGGVVWFTNGLPYAQRLEDGWSGQAPVGFVKLSIAEFDRYIKASLSTK